MYQASQWLPFTNERLPEIIAAIQAEAGGDVPANTTKRETASPRMSVSCPNPLLLRTR